MDLRKLGNSVANLAGEARKRAMDISEKAAKTISRMICNCLVRIMCRKNGLMQLELKEI